MSAHTPGPWRDIGGCGQVFAEVDWDQSVDRVIVMSQLASVDTSRKTWEANARLIAAAPDCSGNGCAGSGQGGASMSTLAIAQASKLAKTLGMEGEGTELMAVIGLAIGH